MRSGHRGTLKRGGKLRSSGTKGNRQRRFYEQERTLHLKKYPYCALCLLDGIRNTDVMIHHRAGRAGALLWHRNYFMTTCFEHHVYIHSHVGQSLSEGWLVHPSKDEQDMINREYRKQGIF